MGSTKLEFMDSEIFKIGLCACLAVFCFTAPEWVPAVVGTEVPCSDVCEHPEDEWCSGATPDCPSHWELWNSLPPTMD